MGDQTQVAGFKSKMFHFISFCYTNYRKKSQKLWSLLLYVGLNPQSHQAKLFFIENILKYTQKKGSDITILLFYIQ